MLLLIKKLIIIHFGKNPIKGGKPPNDKKLINKLILIKKFILLINNWLIKYVFKILNKKHIILIKKEYNIK